jgi:hypothetical protein
MEAVSPGLRTLLITMPRDQALCGLAAAGLAKLPGALPSDDKWSTTGRRGSRKIGSPRPFFPLSSCADF